MSIEVSASIYDYPKYYDLLFGSDVAAEFRFLKACFTKHAGCDVTRVFEPACGTGRLLIKLGRSGYAVAGNDLNPKAVDFCNERLRKYNLPESVVVADMSNFKLKKKFDASFNMINSFRHLATEKLARNHLECMARAMNQGGLYVLGIHLEPTSCPAMQEDLGLNIDVFTPTKRMRIVDHMEYRTYKHSQFRSLVQSVPQLEIAETYDFSYNIRQPHVVSGTTEDVVFVLRRK